MRLVVFVICLIMMTVPLSGCLGGNDIETDEGNDIILEDTDDWPTYYVLTSGDLPACPGQNNDNLGRLYYVESDTNFQACMSTGWQVVQIGGQNGNVLLNQAPIVETNYWFLNDELVTDLTQNGEYDHMLMGMQWGAIDIDGTIAQIGIDYDGDLAIDITLPGNSGLHSTSDYTIGSQAETIPGLFAIPLYQGLTVHKSQTTTTCVIGVTRTISVIAIDDGGATGVSSQTMSAIAPRMGNPIGVQVFNAFHVQDSDYLQSFLTTADIDWIMGQGGSTCPEPPSFTFTPATSFTTGTSDLIGTLTLDSGTATDLQGHSFCAINEFNVYLKHSDNSRDEVYCQDPTPRTMSFTSSGTPTNTWTISENGYDYCNDGTSDCTNMGAWFTIAEDDEGYYCWDAATQSNYYSLCEY